MSKSPVEGPLGPRPLDQAKAETEDQLAGLLEYTDRYYAVAPGFDDDVDTWLEEELRRLP